ncbi:MAG TPA: hypothetical protein VMD07_06270 [Candidatus Acidoferrales bacterium]|nr:hypothetical protein [Candidatus Acidoferrales bacterium]
MIVDDFYVDSLAINPPEADSIALVDADRVLPSSVASKFLQPVARRRTQVFQRVGKRQDR